MYRSALETDRPLCWRRGIHLSSASPFEGIVSSHMSGRVEVVARGTPVFVVCSRRQHCRIRGSHACRSRWCQCRACGGYISHISTGTMPLSKYCSFSNYVRKEPKLDPVKSMLKHAENASKSADLPPEAASSSTFCNCERR